MHHSGRTNPQLPFHSAADDVCDWLDCHPQLTFGDDVNHYLGCHDQFASGGFETQQLLWFLAAG
jgi:hypothetical protein